MEVCVCNTESALVHLYFKCFFPDVLGYSWCFRVLWVGVQLLGIRVILFEDETKMGTKRKVF